MIESHTETTKSYPKNMSEFMENFRTEKQCRDYLISIRYPKGLVCSKCNSKDLWKLKKGIWKCKKCRKDVSITTGTAFENTHVPLTIWFQAVWCLISQKHGVSALGLAHSLGIKREMTVWQLLKKIRSNMIRTSTDLLTGTIEIDEVFIGGIKKGIRGRGALGKVLALVAVEDKDNKGIGRIRIVIIPDSKAETLLKTIQTIVAKGSTIRTDQHPSYPITEKYGYTHKPIQNVCYELGEDTTPLVHRVSALLKRWLLGTHQGGVHLVNMQNYLDEYVFRFNRRTSKSRGKLFYRLIQNMVKKEVVM